MTLEQGQLEGIGSDRVAVAPVPSLGKTTDFVPTPPVFEPLTEVSGVSEGVDVHTVLPPPATVKAWYLRSLGRELLKTHGYYRRMRWCGAMMARRKRAVGVWSRPDRAYGRVSGVCLCGQSIACPVCAPRIAAFRSNEVAEAYQRARNAGWVASLETFTMPHEFSLAPDALLNQFNLFADMWRCYMKHADRRERGTEGHHVAREINWGANGWHFHGHRLRYDQPDSYDQNRARAQWLAVLEQFGLRTIGADEHAYDAGPVNDEAGARYCAKLSTSVEAQARSIGLELASSATKGRNLNTLLSDYARGDSSAASIWVHGAACVTAKKVSSVRWSRGLRAKLGISVDKSDEQISAEEVTSTDVCLGFLTPHQWRGIIAHKAEFTLCIAANQGRAQVENLLGNLDLGTLSEEEPE